MVHHVFDSVGSDPTVFQALSQLEWTWGLLKAEEVPLQSKTVTQRNSRHHQHNVFSDSIESILNLLYSVLYHHL